ncbi:hypothetical protein PR001_g10595 [Phytophthora rubi]|uniref:Uncharacterized protein n=1 Tax=Phytophthora rubi TaxID=129364 RepID=A0A6A3M7V6_9STRA|nr:hypothetical protein PR002_g10858 [Phytophthora rubi]KAE9032464.1 hypothetical protein PR001_g10595 [Phytophthora rubi]
MQLAELLRPFWGDLLQNNLKNVKKFLRENRSKLDFNTARYTPCADGTGLHLCSQHGFTSCAKLLLDIGVKIDLQNKVGSTALHVACKFNQEAMVMFLLEAGARMDIPDMRNNVAFDVAPYVLLDKCLLSPQREKLAAEHEEGTRLLDIHRDAVSHFEEVTTAKAHASMLLNDCESGAWEEWLVLQATNKVDREWSEQVQKSKDTLEIKRAMYTDQQVLLQKEQNQIALMWKNIFRDAQHRQQCAREELEQMLMLTEETHQHWMQEQQELWDQCGLVEAAQEFPNDEDVQQWVLCTMIAMIDESESGCVPVNPHRELVTTDIDELLVREEFIAVVRNVLLRFPAMRDLQFSALQCFVRLARHCVTAPRGTRTHRFLTALIKANIMAISRDVLFRFEEDVEIAHLVVELLYHLLQFRGENGAHSLQFCQHILSHQLPLQVLRLHEVDLPSNDATAPPQDRCFNTTMSARLHTSFLLFTLTKYNVRKTLEKDGALPLVCRLIFQLTNSPPSADTGSNEIKVSTLRYLLGSVALMHSPPSSQHSRKSSSRSDLPASWSVEDLRQLLDSIRPWISMGRTDSALTTAYRSLVFWTIKLLQNLTQPVQDDVVQPRTWFRSRENFDLFAMATLAIRKVKPEEDGDSAVLNIVVVWLELVGDIWLCRFNSDGQLASTAPFILEFLLQLLELEAEIAAGSKKCGTVFTHVAAVLKLVALVLSNGKNMRFLVEQEYKIDVATHTVLKRLVGSMQESSDKGDSHDTSSIELLAHVLRVYLRFFDYEHDHSKSDVNLHERCRAIGICAALHAFNLQDAEHRPPFVNANQSDEKAAEPTQGSKLKVKMQLARAWSRSGVEQASNHSPERETLRSLARALLRHAPCHCYSS